MTKEIGTNFFVYYSELLNRPVTDTHNQVVGVLNDVAMKLNGEIYPKAVSLIIRRGRLLKEFAIVGWEDVQKIGQTIKIKTPRENLSFQRKRIRCDFTLCHDILDQQIVDIDNRKVVRVNDVHLLRVDSNLYLAHVDVGARGLARRLEFGDFIDFVVRLINPRSPYLNLEEFISWKNTHALNLGRAKNLLRVDVSRQKLSQIPATELADIMEDLSIFEKLHLFKSLEISLQRKVFADLPNQQKAELIEELEEKEVVSLLENIPSDEAVDLLLKLPNRRSRHLMRMMETKVSKKLRELLKFDRDSAGGLMTTEYITLPQSSTVQDALQRIKDNSLSLANIYNVYVVDDQGRLVGLAPLRNFISSEPESPLVNALIPAEIFVRTSDTIEETALMLEKYKLTSVPVLNESDVLQGVVTIDDVLEELISLVWHKYREKL